MEKNNNVNNTNFNNNVTEAFSSFGKNNNSTISNAMNNDATIDSKNSIMNIDLKYQKKIDDLERDILNNKNKSDNITNINLNLNDPYYKKEKQDENINNINNEMKNDINFYSHKINANVTNNLEMEDEYSFKRGNTTTNKEPINNNINININKPNINATKDINIYNNKINNNNNNANDNNIRPNNNFMNYQYDNQNNNKINMKENNDININNNQMNHNINDKMVNDIIARNNLLIKQLTNEQEMNKKENNNIIQEDINENEEINENNNLNESEGLNDDSVLGENQLSQMSNMTDRTKLLFKKTMDEYPNLEEDTFFNSIQSKN